MNRINIVLLLTLMLSACVPVDRLSFPAAPAGALGDVRGYDTDADGRIDFAVGPTDRAAGDALDTLYYDDDQDGRADRLYRLSDYAAADVPHLIVLLDSIPFAAMQEAWQSGERWTMFGEPRKVIAPFPSLSPLCFSAILGAPPMAGIINRYYDPRPPAPGVNNLIARRVAGYRNPWQRRLHYNIDYRDNAAAFLKPRPFLEVELERARQALDANPDRVTLVYISSTAAMLAKYGRAGLDETLDQFERFVLQILHERRGAIKISVLADHGHNLLDTTWLDVKAPLKAAGFNVTDRLRTPDDVFVEMDGLLTYFGVHTARPVVVADALLAGLPQVETISYQQLDRITVRNHAGQASITRDADGRLRYHVNSANVLEFPAELQDVPLSADEWFTRTADLEFPDAPPRLWDAFHGGTVTAPQVMVTLDDGYCAGIGWFQWFITMRSTHGGLNQVNSATFVMSMTGRLDDLPPPGALRAHEVLPRLEPNWTPAVQPER